MRFENKKLYIEKCSLVGTYRSTGARSKPQAVKKRASELFVEGVRAFVGSRNVEARGPLKKWRRVERLNPAWRSRSLMQ
jgi:hypothetical protein